MANVQLARNLKTLRLKYNYTQKDLSAILNITRQAYSHYESAQRARLVYVSPLFSFL